MNRRKFRRQSLAESLCNFCCYGIKPIVWGDDDGEDLGM